MEKFQFDFAPYTEEVPIFIAEQIDTSTLKPWEKDVFDRLFKMKLEEGFMGKLLQEEYFEQWICLPADAEDSTWFDSILEMASTVDGRKKFDNCCQALMTEFLKFFLKAVQERKSTDASYELDVYQFLCSDYLDHITEHHLPMPQATVRPCCFVLALSLDRLLSTMVTEALQCSMRSRFPDLFKKKR